MDGKVTVVKTSKAGFPYAIIKASSGGMFRCNNRGMIEGKVEDLTVGTSVEFELYKNMKGQTVATQLKIKDTPPSEVLSDEEKMAIHSQILEYVNKTGPIFLTKLNEFLIKKRGVDYHYYGYQKAKMFFQENFSDILDFDDVDINGNKQTTIRLKSEYVTDDSTYPIAEKNTSSIYEEFDRLVANDCLDAALRSELIQTTSPAKLPLDYMVKAIKVATKLLHIVHDYELSEFDKKLITEPTSGSLYKMKTGTLFMQQGKNECSKICDASEFKKYFNNLINAQINNTTYLELAKRFQFVHNRLLWPFYVLALYTNKGTIDEFLKYSPSDTEFEYFKAFNLVAKDTVFSGQQLSMDGDIYEKNYLTKVLSIALDHDRFDVFEDLAKKVMTEVPAFVNWLDEDDIKCDSLTKLLDGRYSYQVVEKYINYYLYRKFNDGTLRVEIIQLFSQIAYTYPISYLEEILFIDSYTGFGKKSKRDLLVNNFDKIIDYMGQDKKAYILACYVVDRFMSDVSSDRLDKMKHTSREIFDIASRDPSKACETYPYFKEDEDGKKNIERIFLSYIDRAYNKNIETGDCEAIIKHYQDNGCDFAVVHFLKTRQNSEELLNDPNLSKIYFSALSASNYSEAIKYITNTDGTATEIIRILYRNFKELGVTSQAFEIFNDDFSLDTAEKLALDNFTANNGTPIILMGIYHKKSDSIKIHYLRALYYKLTNVGNRTFYSQLFNSDIKLASSNDHYQVIRKAITALDCSKIFSFLDWASRIPIDSRYKEEHKKVYVDPCKFELDSLLKNPKNERSWEKLILKLSSEKVGQLTTAFGLAVLDAYFSFHEAEINGNIPNENTNEITKLVLDKMMSFTSFSKVEESTKFISLNIKLIKIMPESYIITLCDIFHHNQIIWGQNAQIKDSDINEMYTLLLEMYNETYNREYVKLALEILCIFKDRITPHFELIKHFCESTGEKDILFRALFNAYQVAFQQEWHDFIYYDGWNCSNEEQQVLTILKLLYSTEDDTLPWDVALLPAYKLHCLKNDLAKMLQDYPQLYRCNTYTTLMDSDESLAYKYLVLKYIMGVLYDQKVYREISDKYWDPCNESKAWIELERDVYIDGVRAALDFYKTCYAKQTKDADAQKLGIEYITRRYINLLLIDSFSLMLAGRDLNAISDDYIIELMHENGHTSLVLEKHYKKFKEALFDLLESSLSLDSKKVLLMSIIRGSICPLVDNTTACDEILSHAECHVLVIALISMTGYPSMAQSAIYQYLSNKNMQTIIGALCREMLPFVHHAILAFEALTDIADRQNMLDFMHYVALEDDHKKLLKNVFGKQNEYFDEANYCRYKDILVNVTISTTFHYNILRDLGNRVRDGKIQFSNQFYHDLLLEMGSESSYWYLLSIRYALNNQRDDASAFFYRVGGKTNIPEIWEVEYDQLEQYVKGGLRRFSPVKYSNKFSADRESSIGSTNLLAYAQNIANEEIDKPKAKNALYEFSNKKNLLIERVNHGAAVLKWIGSKSSEFYSIKPDSNKITYNEFLFEFGLLLIDSRVIKIDQKISVLIELFDNFELLNDSNQRKYLRSLEYTFTELIGGVKSRDDTVSYDLWLNYHRKIRQIIEKYSIGLDGIDDFWSILSRCLDFEHSEHTNMAKIQFFATLPNDIVLSPIARNFLNSAKKECERLRKNVMAQIFTVNSEIEDDSIFTVLENLQESKTSINLLSGTQKPKLVVSVVTPRIKEPIVFETSCSGNAEIDNTIKVLRPGQVLGGRITLPKYVIQRLREGDYLTVDIVLVINGAKICSNSDNNQILKFHYTQSNGDIIKTSKQYQTLSCAFQPGNRGFGRTTEIEKLEQNLLTPGLSVVYGPSRVGKSSLMQYIINQLSTEYKLCTGRFDSQKGKLKSLYVISHAENYFEMPDTETERLAFLFLEPIKEEMLSLALPEAPESESQDLSQAAISSILRLIDDPALSLNRKLEKISKILSGENSEIWVLIDEFQDVVDTWAITKSNQFDLLCKQLIKSIANIKYVVCGADALVKLMISHDRVLFAQKTCPVSQFKDNKEYIAMLCDQNVWETGKSPYSKEALDYIFSYTGGNPMYGKLVGNRLIDLINSGIYDHRRQIYPFDVSLVMAQMILSKNRDIEENKYFNEFAANVTKNLEAESQYLRYIASAMMNAPDRTGISLSEIYEWFGAYEPEQKHEIDTALELCNVRGILEEHDQQYSFSTTFYFSVYCELALKEGVPERVAQDPVDSIDESDTEYSDPQSMADEIVDKWNSLIKFRYEDEAVLKKAKEMVMENIKGNTTVNNFNISAGGTGINNGEVQNMFQFNVQNITNTLNCILASGCDAAKIISGLQTLPRLDAYIEDDKAILLEELDSADPELVAEAETKLEASTTQMVADYLAALVSRNDVPDSFCAWTQLGIGKLEYDTLSEAIAPSFMAELILATKLDHIFSLAERGQYGDSSVQDYSPVSIMYCKIFEKMLKLYHTDMYISRFPKASTEVKDEEIKNHKFKFCELGNMEKGQKSQVQNKILLGAFLYPIHPDHVNDSRWKEIANNSSEQAVKWKKHSQILLRVKEIRNSSAHGADGVVVDRAMLSELKFLLFEKEGLKAILDLH